MDKLYEQIIANKQKAIVGFVVLLIGSLFAKHGIDITQITVADAIQALAYGVIGYVSVYLKRNKG